MLTPRQIIILQRLLTSVSYVNSDALSEYAGVSGKTIQNDLGAVTDFLAAHAISLESKRGSGYRLHYNTTEARDELSRVLTNLQFASNDRLKTAAVYIVIMLKDGYTTQDELAELLFTNKNMIKQLVNELNSNLVFVGLQIHSVSGKGYTLSGAEQCKRMVCIGHIESISNQTELFQRISSAVAKNFNTNLFIDMTSIHKILEANDLEFSQLCIEKLRVYITLLISRSATNHHVQSLNDLSFIVTPIPKMIEVSQRIINFLGLEVFPLEVHLLSVFLLFLVDTIELSPTIGTNYSAAFTDYRFLIDSFFSRRNNLYSNIFVDVNRVKQQVKSLIAVMVDENLLGYNRSLILESDFDDELFVAIEIASLLCFQFENVIRVRFNNANIISLALVINFNFKDNIWIKRQDIYVFSRESSLYARLLCRKLKMRFKESVNPIYLNSYEELRSVRERKSRAVIITDEGKYQSSEYFYTFPSLSYGASIIASFRDSLSTTRQANKAFLASFSPETFHLHFNAASMDHVIQYITEKYQCSAERTKTIFSNVIVRELRYVSVVFKTVAVPRIYIDTITLPIIEVFQLDKSILWNRAEIGMVFVIILPGSYEHLTLVGRPLTDVVKDTTFIEQARTCQSFEAFYALLSAVLS